MNVESQEPGSESVAAERPDVTRLEALEVSVRRHRIWLAVLTAALGLLVVAGCASVGLMGMGFGSGLGDMGVDDEAAAQTKSAIQQAYGSRLKDVEVRAVKVNYDDVPFPFSLMGGSDMESLYVEYQLEGSSVTVADVMTEGMMGADVAASGMLPTKGSLVSRMTPEQFSRLLVAYADETNEPLGSVRRYGDSMYGSEPGVSIPDEVNVGSKAYPSKELWAATEGRIVEGDEVDMRFAEDMGRDALIFHEDPETGEFTFLGVEPAGAMW